MKIFEIRMAASEAVKEFRDIFSTSLERRVGVEVQEVGGDFKNLAPYLLQEKCFESVREIIVQICVQ